MGVNSLEDFFAFLLRFSYICNGQILDSMKKAILTALLGSAVLVSCNKETTTTTPTLPRYFSYEMRGNSMYQTRAQSAEDVLYLINEALPEHIACNFEGDKYFVVQTGTYQELPSGTYNVSGTYMGAEEGGILSANLGAVSLSPAVRINQTLTITDEETEYSLAGSYFCFALVWDDALVDRIEFRDAYGNTHTMPSLTRNDTHLVFVQGYLETNYLNLTIYPKDTDTYAETEYTIATKGGTGLRKAEYGKYYVIAPTFGGNQPKWIQLDLPDFVQGEF